MKEMATEGLTAMMDKGKDIRRCLVDDNAIGDKYHFWSVHTGKKIPNPGFVDCYDQQCPKHGGSNTVKDAMKQGVPKREAMLCELHDMVDAIIEADCSGRFAASFGDSLTYTGGWAWYKRADLRVGFRCLFTYDAVGRNGNRLEELKRQIDSNGGGAIAVWDRGEIRRYKVFKTVTDASNYWRVVKAKFVKKYGKDKLY